MARPRNDRRGARRPIRSSRWAIRWYGRRSRSSVTSSTGALRLRVRAGSGSARPLDAVGGGHRGRSRQPHRCMESFTRFPWSALDPARLLDKVPSIGRVDADWNSKQNSQQEGQKRERDWFRASAGRPEKPGARKADTRVGGTATARTRHSQGTGASRQRALPFSGAVKKRRRTVFGARGGTHG